MDYTKPASDQSISRTAVSLKGCAKNSGGTAGRDEKGQGILRRRG
jgi:hypothetical protein